MSTPPFCLTEMEPSREPTFGLLSSKDFVPEKCNLKIKINNTLKTLFVDVRELSQSCVGGPELRRLRKRIQTLSEETSSNLKKNVYLNYMQFIDTAKEISSNLKF
jgi:hypothetical protein